MKKTVIIIAAAVLFVILLAVAATVFPRLKEQYAENSGSAVLTEAGELTPAADFTVYDRDGKAVKLSDFKGKPTVVNFWATWCYYCVEELPDFDSLYGEYGDRVNFVIVDLVDGFSETQENGLAFIKEKGFTFPVYFDTDENAASVYSISSIPLTLIVDKDGNIYKTQIGLMEGQTLRAYLEALTGEDK